MKTFSPFTVDAVVVLDTEGNRLLSKYYRHDEEYHGNKKKQDAFEAQLFSRTRKAPNSTLNGTL